MAASGMATLRKIIILCLYIKACCGHSPTQRNTTPAFVLCPRKTTTHRTTTHSTLQTTHSHAHTTVNYTTARTNSTITPHPTAHTNHTTTPMVHANTTTPHPTAHTNHTTTPTVHTNTTTPHPTAHTNHTTTPTVHANTTYFTTIPVKNHTSLPPTTAPPTEYVVNGTTGVCLRITASFNISFNDTRKPQIVIPPPPSTHAFGNCSTEKAWLTLTFPQGQLTITFRKDTEGNKYFLGAVNITLKDKGSERFGNESIRDLLTPLGRAFSCAEVDIQVTSNVTLSVMKVKAQAFKLEGGKYGQEMKCSDGRHNMMVPIVVGVVLLVLILIVVIAYFVACQRRPRGYHPL